MTDLLTRPEVEQQTQTGSGPGEQAHIVWVPEEFGESPHAYVMRARIEGFEVQALCGYVWVPNKMATGLPVCPYCEDIYNAHVSNPDDGLPEE